MRDFRGVGDCVVVVVVQERLAETPTATEVGVDFVRGREVQLDRRDRTRVDPPLEVFAGAVRRFLERRCLEPLWRESSRTWERNERSFSSLFAGHQAFRYPFMGHVRSFILRPSNLGLSEFSSSKSREKDYAEIR